MTPKEVFSIIMVTFDRPAMLREAVDSFFRQTYKNIEVVIVNNAGTMATEDYLREIEADQRVKIIHFSESQFDICDLGKFTKICFNAGLEASTGNYIWYNSDDDLIADDFVEKMVALFEGNSKCTTATGLPVAINEQGNLLQSSDYFRSKNIRPRYVAGHLMALDHLRGGKMYSSPGGSFAIRRDELIKAGGYHSAYENHIILGIIPFGVTGYDETAFYYWRYHDQQVNKQLTSSGNLTHRDTFSLLFDWGLEKRWKQLGEDVAKKVVTTLENRIYAESANCFVVNLYNFRFIATIRLVFGYGKYLPFWIKIPHLLYIQRFLFKVHMKSFLNVLFDFFPHLNKIFPRLSEKLNK